MVRNSLNHSHLNQQLPVDFGYTKVIATRVGVFGTSVFRAAKPKDFTRAKRDKPPHEESSSPLFPQGELREFTLAELGKATANFSDNLLIGCGGFGKVFRGILSDGTVVAVKVMENYSVRILDQFYAEIRVSCALMAICHPNLVPALGYHTSRKRKLVKLMIVYPFMDNGDVGIYLGNCQPSRTPLDWPTRKMIVLGVAKGLSSLHELGIVHGDIKPSNVMLDENFEAHIGDFGLAKSNVIPHNSYDITAGLHVDLDSDHYYTTQLCGTLWYMSPELLLSGHCTRESDVYAFGVTLIQIATGKPVIEKSEEDNPLPILYRAEQLLKNKEDLAGFMHSMMLGVYDESEAIELILLGLVCTHGDSEKRPLMPEVIATMEGNSTTLKQRWDNYGNTWSTRQRWFYNQSEQDSDMSSHSTRFSYVGTDGSQSGDEEVAGPLKFNIKEEDFTTEPEEANKEHQAWLINSANSRSLEKGSLDEIVKVDETERGNQKQLSSQANRYIVATKLKELQDQMWEMELKHETEMEEMYQKQIAIMQSMNKMQGEYIQKVNEMQSQMNQLKEDSQKL